MRYENRGCVSVNDDSSAVSADSSTPGLNAVLSLYKHRKFRISVTAFWRRLSANNNLLPEMDEIYGGVAGVSPGHQRMSSKCPGVFVDGTGASVAALRLLVDQGGTGVLFLFVANTGARQGSSPPLCSIYTNFRHLWPWRSGPPLVARARSSA